MTKISWQRRRAIREMVGHTFGRLTVVAFAGSRRTGNGGALWRCKCACGGKTIAKTSDLRSGVVKACGCLLRYNLIGQRFGRLTVIGNTKRRTGGRQQLWRCKCICRNKVIVRTSHLSSGLIRSCGCLRVDVSRAKISHVRQFHKSKQFKLSANDGHYINGKKSPEFSSFMSMHQRCNDPNHHNYKHYGGRGIAVCRRWFSFKHFLADMGPKPTPDYTIDRINNDRGYKPSNCRWETKVNQPKHRRDRQGL